MRERLAYHVSVKRNTREDSLDAIMDEEAVEWNQLLGIASRRDGVSKTFKRFARFSWAGAAVWVLEPRFVCGVLIVQSYHKSYM